ncbi:Polyketide cyclase / dehydrase and lipid transport [compost metagenome]
MAVCVEEPVIIRADVDTFFQVITNMEAYPEFLSSIRSVDLLRKNPHELWAGVDSHLVFDWHYLQVLRPEFPHRIAWEMVDGPFREARGEWLVEKVHADRLETLYVATIEFGRFIPRRLLEMGMHVALPELLRQYATRMEACALQPA